MVDLMGGMHHTPWLQACLLGHTAPDPLKMHITGTRAYVKLNCTFPTNDTIHISFHISPEYKQTSDPHPNCQVCLKTMQTVNMPHPPKTPRLTAVETCPACGIPLNSKLTGYLKRTRTSTFCDKDVITSEMVPVDAADIADEKLPWEPVKYNEYSDAIGCLLLKKWKFGQATEHIAQHEVGFVCSFLNDIDTKD